MTLYICKLLSLSGRQSAQGNSLIKLHIIADFRSLSDYYACSVIDKEILSDLRPGINIDPGFSMGVLRHDPGDKWYLVLVQDVCQPVYIDGKYARIGKNDLLFALCRRISVKTCLHIF